MLPEDLRIHLSDPPDRAFGGPSAGSREPLVKPTRLGSAGLQLRMQEETGCASCCGRLIPSQWLSKQWENELTIDRAAVDQKSFGGEESRDHHE
jgi:hypothetical protein